MGDVAGARRREAFPGAQQVDPLHQRGEPVERAQARAQQERVQHQGRQQSRPSTATSAATIGADTVTGENTSSADDASSTATLTRNTRRKSPRIVAGVPPAGARAPTAGRCSVTAGIPPGSSPAAGLSMRSRTHPKMGVAPDIARSRPRAQAGAAWNNNALVAALGSDAVAAVHGYRLEVVDEARCAG